MVLYQLKHVNIDYIDSKVVISMLMIKVEKCSLQALLDKNPTQSTSEFARELNVDVVVQQLLIHDMLFK